MILVAELGDKTMLMSIIFSAEYRKPLTILALALLALSTVTLIGIGVGLLIIELIPVHVLKYISGSLFLIIGLYYLLTPVQEKQTTASKKGLTAFLALMFISEFGDKTQISIISLTISTMSPIGVFTGAIIGFTVINLIAVILGDRVSGKIKPAIIKRISAIIFIAFSVLTFIGIL